MIRLRTSRLLPVVAAAALTVTTGIGQAVAAPATVADDCAWQSTVHALADALVGVSSDQAEQLLAALVAEGIHPGDPLPARCTTVPQTGAGAPSGGSAPPSGGSQAGDIVGSALGSLLYARDSFWNVPIDATAAVDPDSAKMVDTAFVSRAHDANLTNTDDWGVPLYRSTNADPVATVTCTTYCEQGKSFQFNIPEDAKPTTGSDHHLVVVNTDTGKELDLWIAEGGGTSWTAGSVFVSDARGWGALCALGQHCNGANAAGFALFGGLITPEEMARGEIKHALAINTPYTRSGYIACPATHTDGPSSDAGAVPEGARVQLDPSVDVRAQSWDTWQKIIATALQRYGAYVVDTAGTVTIRAQSNGDWPATGVPIGPSLSWIPWSKLRVLELKEC